MGYIKKLSHSLLDLGFFCALGTTEHCGGGDNGSLVKAGTPNTCDHSNDVNVVYDEEGRPWIQHSSKVTLRTFATIREYELCPGAYIPHSSDGGYFVREVLPTLVLQSTKEAS